VATTIVRAPEEGCNLVVQSLPRAAYLELVGRMGGGGEAGRYLEEHLVCYSTTLSRADEAALLRAALAIPDDLDAAETEQCVWHELMHAYGIFGHPDERVASVLRNAVTPTDNDIVLLRALYDPRLDQVRPETAREQAQAVIAALLREREGPPARIIPAAPLRPAANPGVD